MAALIEIFPGCLIFCLGDIHTQPACLPDLTPCDYFLWGYLKSEVYKHNIQAQGQRRFESCILLKDRHHSAADALQSLELQKPAITMHQHHSSDLSYKTKSNRLTIILIRCMNTVLFYHQLYVLNLHLKSSTFLPHPVYSFGRTPKTCSRGQDR